MKVQLVPGDNGGCALYRMALPHGYTETETIYDNILNLIHPQPGAPPHDAFPVDDEVEVVVLQRPMQTAIVEAIPHLQRRGIAVVVELDDDIFATPKGNQVHSVLNMPDHNLDNLRRAIRLCDHFTCSTDALARLAPSKSTVIRNAIPDQWVTAELPAPASRLTVGWTGALKTHVGDIESTGKGIATAVVEHDATLHVVGDKNALPVFGVPPSHGSWEPWAAYDVGYPGAIATFDVGVVPLVTSRFNDAKSWLKGLEYAALGVPHVAADTPEYRLSDFTTALADSPAAWHEDVSRLLSDLPFRTEESVRVREVVAAEHTMSVRAYRYDEAWEHALHVARARRRFRPYPQPVTSSLLR